MGVMALLPEKEAHRLEALQSTCAALDVPLFGGIFPALIAQSKFLAEGMLLLCFELAPHHFLVDKLQEGGSKKIAQAIKAASPAQSGLGHRAKLFLLFDGMVGNINTLMGEVHLQLQSPPLYSGINAGSETFQPMPCLFDATRCVGDGVLGVFLPEDAQPVIRHAYPASESRMRASSSVGNRIVSIDGRPAFEVYQEVVAREYGQVLTSANFYELAVHFPFGLVTAVDIVVRIPVALGEDGSLVCVGEVPPDSMLHLLKAPVLEESDCVTEIVYAIAEQSPSQGVQSLLTFYCAGRRLHFGARAEEELAALQEDTQCKEQFGALTLGEIDSEADLEFPRFHNAALVCFAQTAPACPKQRSTNRTQYVAPSGISASLKS